jgi:hypothetical protein
MRLTLLTDRAEYVLQELADKCRIIDTDIEFTRIELLDSDPMTLLKLFQAGHKAGFDACLTELKRKFKTAGFNNY